MREIGARTRRVLHVIARVLESILRTQGKTENFETRIFREEFQLPFNITY